MPDDPHALYPVVSDSPLADYRRIWRLHVTILIARELQREESRAELEGEEEYLLNNPLNYVHSNFKNYVADFIHISRQGLHEEHRY